MNLLKKFSERREKNTRVDYLPGILKLVILIMACYTIETYFGRQEMFFSIAVVFFSIKSYSVWRSKDKFKALEYILWDLLLLGVIGGVIFAVYYLFELETMADAAILAFLFMAGIVYLIFKLEPVFRDPIGASKRLLVRTRHFLQRLRYDLWR